MTREGRCFAAALVDASGAAHTRQMAGRRRLRYVPSRRRFLRTGLVAGSAALAGCSFGSAETQPLDATVVELYLLNRRSSAHTVHLAVEYGGEVIRALSRRVDGTENASRPTSVEYADWPDEPGKYRFAARLDDSDSWLRVTSREFGVTESGADCLRPSFVVNLGDRFTAHARTPCDGPGSE